MGFKENLLQKITIDRLGRQVLSTLGATPEGPQKLDRESMRTLLRLGGYTYRRERDLDLYYLSAAEEILVLDNELKIYRTSIEDVVLRKSPTVKEMVNIRNAIKILNDKDVVVSRKQESLARVRDELISGLDLDYSPNDIETLAAEGITALRNGDPDGVIECITLFAELLGYRENPKGLGTAHHRVWGALSEPRPGEIVIEPLISLGLMHYRLRMLRGPISTLDRAAMERFALVLKGSTPADLEGEAVWAALQQEVLTRRPTVR